MLGSNHYSCGVCHFSTTNNTAGTNSNGGTNSSNAGTNSNGGTNNNTAGTNNNGGTNNNNGGTNNNTAGTNGNGGRPGTGGTPDPGAGGAAADGCPATMPADGATCMQGDSPFQGCDYGDTNCRCRRVNGGQMRAWQCQAAQGTGVVCPANAMDGDPCTGQGLCAGQQCFCNNGQTNCF